MTYLRARLKLYQKYFAALLQTQKREMPPSMSELLRLSQSTVEALTGMQRQLIRARERDALLAARVERLASIPGVGRVVALTWGTAQPAITNGFFHGCEAVDVAHLQRPTRGKTERTPISKQRNKQLQNHSCGSGETDAAMEHGTGAGLRARENREEIANRATLAVGGANWWLMRLVLPRKPQ